MIRFVTDALQDPAVEVDVEARVSLWAKVRDDYELLTAFTARFFPR